MNQIIENPGFQHITEKIFLDLSYEDLLKCQFINKTSKKILANPLFWLKKWSLSGLSEKNQADWMKAIQITKNSILEMKIILYFQRIIQRNLTVDIPCFIDQDVVDRFKTHHGMMPILILSPMETNIASGNIGIVQALVTLMDNPLAPDVMGRTPIHMALDIGNVEIIKVLAPFAENVNAPCHCPEQSIIWNMPNVFERIQTPIRFAIWKGHLEIIKILAYFISNAQIDRNRISEIQDAMMLAADIGRFDIVKVLRPFLQPKKEDV